MGIEAAVAGAVVGGVMQNRAAKKQAAAMNSQAAAQVEAARIAAEEQRFRPVGITTRFGSATPQFTDNRLTGYTYQGSPEVTALQDQLSRIYGTSLGQAEQAATYQPQFQRAAEGLFALGQQEMPQSREQIMAEQQALLRPYDIEEEQRLAAGVFGRGRGGLSVGAGGQPELQALAESRRRRDLQLAAGADQAAQQQIAFGQGLLGGSAQTTGLGYGLQQQALAPFQAQFGTAQGLDDAAKQSLQMGLGIGEAASLAGARGGELYGNNMARANTSFQQQGNIRGGMLSGMGQSFGNMLGGMSMPTGGTNPMNINLAGGGSFTQGNMAPGYANTPSWGM